MRTESPGESSSRAVRQTEGVVLIVGREGLERGVETVALGDEPVEVVSDGGEFGAVAAGEDDVVDESAGTEVEEGEGDDAGAFVGGGFGAVDEAGDVFSGTEDEDFHGHAGNLFAKDFDVRLF